MSSIIRYVAFLRAMNVGGRRITNGDLVAAFAQIGFDSAVAYQASGNVIISSRHDPESIEGVLEAGLQTQLGYTVPTMVRSQEQLTVIAAASPFSDDVIEASNGKVQVMILERSLGPDGHLAIDQFATTNERLVASQTGSEVYWLPASGVGTTELNLDALAREIGRITVRTQGTIQRLVKKLT